MKNIYILLTNTGTIASRTIRMFSDLKYTHSAVSLDIMSKEFYSFSRKFTYLVLPGGMITENLDNGNFKRFKTCGCCLYKLSVTDNQYKKLNKLLHKMIQNKKYRYNVLGLLLCKFNVEYERKRHRFCSEFVAEVLGKSGIVALEKSRSLYRPSDLAKINGMEKIYEGTLESLSKYISENRI
jgi:inositol transport system substrate-binding protein